MNSISIVVPIYYGEKYIPHIICQIEACRTYLSTEDYVEILFVNDAPDAPLSQKWESELVKIIIINPEYHSGIHGARVKGLRQAQGNHVLFLDQDDRIKPGYFYSQLQAIGENDAVVCKGLNGGKEFYVDDEMFKNSIKKDFVLRAWNLIISPGQVLIRKQAIPNMWTQNIMQYNGADDWFLWLCMLAEGYSFSLNNDILYEHIMQESNASNDIINMLQSEQELIRIVQGKKMFCDNDFQLLMEGFFEKNIGRTRELYHTRNNAIRKLDILDKWGKLKERNVEYADYLHQNNIQTIAIYGCGTVGVYLYTELKSFIDVKYFIDRNSDALSKEIPVYSLQDVLPEVDGIIISLTGETENAEKAIKEKGYKNVFILKDWILETK